MKVLVCLNIPDVGIALMKSEGIEMIKWTNDLPMTAKELNTEAKEYDALLTTSNYKIDKVFLEENTLNN